MWATSQSSRWNAFPLEWRPRDNPYTPASHIETCRIMCFKVSALKLWFSNWKSRQKVVLLKWLLCQFLPDTNHAPHAYTTHAKLFFTEIITWCDAPHQNKELNHVVIFLRIQIYIFQKKVSFLYISPPTNSSFCEFYCYFLIEKIKSRVAWIMATFVQ